VLLFRRQLAPGTAADERISKPWCSYYRAGCRTEHRAYLRKAISY